VHAKFIRTIVEEKAAKNSGNLLNVIFQDNQNHKEMKQTTLHTVKYVFINRM
jgi:hypothetical protein